MKKILILSFLLFPFQNLAIPLAQSRFDITCFLLLFLTMYYTIKNRKINIKTFNIIFIFVLVQSLIFIVLSIAPFARFFSAIVWLGGLLLIILTAPKILFNILLISKIIIGLCICIALIISLQYYLMGIERPSASFDEPTSAGLVLYSACTSIIAVLIIIRTNFAFKRNAIFVLTFIISAALITKSMHIVTLLVTLSIILLIKLLNLHKKFSLKPIITILIIISTLTFFSITVFQDSHYLKRIDISNAESNLSLLSWLRGWDQMKASLINSPIIGYGLGSTGYFKFNSIYSNELMLAGIGDLNLKDGFSLAFRLIIEIGPLLFLLFIGYMFKQFRFFKKVLLKINEINTNESIPSIFLFVFATSLIIGSLLKEPTYAKSPLYIGVFLFSSPILKNNLK